MGINLALFKCRVPNIYRNLRESSGKCLLARVQDYIMYQKDSSMDLTMKNLVLGILLSIATLICYAQEQTLSQQTLATSATTTPTDTEMIFSNHNPLVIALSFTGLGLLLAFTPCVLPMVPILSGLILGHRRKSPKIKTFSLSLAYVAGMAITYAIAGIVVAMIGNHIQTQLQKPWVIALFSGIFVLLALSLFGIYDFQIPSNWQKRLTQLSNQQKSGTYFGVFAMGSLSSLLVSPCISPALVGVLAYIAHTGNIGLGALALLSLGIGMGLPLLLVGASVAKFLPKAGAWMQTIERFVGIMMLAVAIWLLSRIIPGSFTLFLWSILLITSAILMGNFGKAWNQWHPVRHSLAIIALIYGIILLIGAALGNANPLRPWENMPAAAAAATPSTSHTTQASFTTIQNTTQLEKAFAQAKREGRWVILDFHADWCESCVYMDRYIFSRPDVKQTFADFILLRDNITADTSFDETLMDHFHIVGTPTLLFFAPNGKELINERWVGEATASELIAHIKKLQETTRAN